MIRCLDDIVFLRENLQMRSKLHYPSYNFPFNEKMNYSDNSFAQSQIDSQNSSIDFSNQFLERISGLHLDEDDDKTNLSSLYFYKDDKIRIKYNFELKPLFLEKIEKESENCNPPKNVRSEYCLKLVQVSSIQYIVNILIYSNLSIMKFWLIVKLLCLVVLRLQLKHHLLFGVMFPL